MSLHNISDARQMFESLDSNNDGRLSLDELTILLEKIGVRACEHDLASLVGKDGLNFHEFSCFYDTILLKNNSDGLHHDDDDDDGDLQKAFKVFDLNGDGLISPQELQSVLWKLGMWGKYGGLDCDRIIRKYDVNNDGFVDFGEFKTMMLAH